MDKKSKYTQSSAKGTAGDSKKSQDVSNNKLFPKPPRKREPPGASNFAKYEQPRKCNVQKAKSFDKRPKPKGLYHGGPKEDSKVVDQDSAEVGSVCLPGSKKQNLNHLLNFHYESRDVHGLNAWSHGKSSNGHSRHSNRLLPPTQRHKYNKEQFLQASCQFVVTENGDYTLYLTDPDALVDWKLIEQIKLYSHENLSCPICLCAPIAGKITRCGHVYCWPCILHYLSLSDKTWRKCPICYESVHKSDLKSVVEVSQTTFNLGDNISLRLMRRERGSLIAVPVSDHVASAPTMFFAAAESSNGKAYSKLLLANVNDVKDIIEWERVQLKLEMADNPQSPENCYIEEALNDLQTREEGLIKKQEVKTEAANQSAVGINQGESYCENNHEQESQQRQFNEGSVNASESENVQLSDDHTIASGASDNACPSSSTSKFFYFYQAEDGQNVYLHAMNVKMLEMQYGNLEHCPHTITGKLLEKEGGSFTEELRRRLRYLCHLPITSQFEMAEIELKPPIVSEDILHSFREQLDMRQRRRQRRERDERKRDKKITEEVNKQMGKYPTPNVQIESRQHFPDWQPEILFAEDYVQESPTESITASSIASSPSQSTLEEFATNNSIETQPDQPAQAIQSSPPHEEFQQTLSFAEMLRNRAAAKARPGPEWPSIRSSRTRSRSGTEMESAPRSNDEEKYASTPWRKQSLAAALARAQEQAKFNDSGTERNNGRSGRKVKEKLADYFVRN